MARHSKPDSNSDVDMDNTGREATPTDDLTPAQKAAYTRRLNREASARRAKEYVDAIEAEGMRPAKAAALDKPAWRGDMASTDGSQQSLHQSQSRSKKRKPAKDIVVEEDSDSDAMLPPPTKRRFKPASNVNHKESESQSKGKNKTASRVNDPPRPIVPRDLIDRLSSSESESGFGGPRPTQTGPRSQRPTGSGSSSQQSTLRHSQTLSKPSTRPTSSKSQHTSGLSKSSHGRHTQSEVTQVVIPNSPSNAPKAVHDPAGPADNGSQTEGSENASQDDASDKETEEVERKDSRSSPLDDVEEFKKTTPTIRISRERANTIKASKKDKDIPILDDQQPQNSKSPDQQVEADDTLDVGPQMPAGTEADDNIDAETFQDQEHQLAFELFDAQVDDDGFEDQRSDVEDAEEPEAVKPLRSKRLLRKEHHESEDETPQPVDVVKRVKSKPKPTRQKQTKEKHQTTTSQRQREIPMIRSVPDDPPQAKQTRRPSANSTSRSRRPSNSLHSTPDVSNQSGDEDSANPMLNLAFTARNCVALTGLSPPLQRVTQKVIREMLDKMILSDAYPDIDENKFIRHLTAIYAEVCETKNQPDIMEQVESDPVWFRTLSKMLQGRLPTERGRLKGLISDAVASGYTLTNSPATVKRVRFLLEAFNYIYPVAENERNDSQTLDYTKPYQHPMIIAALSKFFEGSKAVTIRKPAEFKFQRKPTSKEKFLIPKSMLAFAATLVEINIQQWANGVCTKLPFTVPSTYQSYQGHLQLIANIESKSFDKCFCMQRELFKLVNGKQQLQSVDHLVEEAETVLDLDGMKEDLSD